MGPHGEGRRAAPSRPGAATAPPPGRRAPPGPGIGVALAAHAGIRAAGLLVLWAAAQATGASAYHALTRWDAAWFRRIADHGYGHVRIAPDGRELSDQAFFPLYPHTEGAVAHLTGLPTVDAGLVVSAVASLVAAAGIYRVGTDLHSARVGLVLACLWSCTPVAVVQSMAYSESLFTALVAWGLYALLAQRFVVAGVLAGLAGLTRLMGVALVVAVLVAVAMRLRELRRAGEPQPAAVVAPLVGAVLAPVGLAAYLTYVGLARGTPWGYLEAAGDWGNRFDGGLTFARWVAGELTGPHPLLGVALLAALALLVAAVAHTAGPPYPRFVLAFTLVAVLVALTPSGYLGSRPRYLVPVFTLLLWPSVALSWLPPRLLAGVLGGLAAASAAYGALWLLGPGPP